jgi:hypothetical protein
MKIFIMSENLSARWNKQKESNKIELPKTANDLEWCPTTTSQNDSNMFIFMGDYNSCYLSLFQKSFKNGFTYFKYFQI